MHNLLNNSQFLSALYPVIAHTVRIVLILLVAYILTRIVAGTVPRVRAHIVKRMTRNEMNMELEKRAATLGGIFRKTVGIVIWIVALIMALKEAGFDIGPILAGAGIVGLAVGFGAQNLVRDVISGTFILLEDQIRVNDVAIINGTGGLVEQINLRTTVLRGQDGTVHIFPNGAITSLSNMTHGFSYYVFDLGVAYKEDTDRVAQTVKEIADAMMKEDAYRTDILEPMEILGVDKFADSAVIVKARIKTMPIKQWTIGREMNRRIKKEFDRLGIEIPFPHMSVYFGEASKPFALRFDQDREELKSLLREVVAEELQKKQLPPTQAAAG
jgi:moderate conductance mechanosensitive channel